MHACAPACAPAAEPPRAHALPHARPRSWLAKNHAAYFSADHWVKASGGLVDEWVADLDKRGYNGRALLNDARELLVKYRK